MITEYFEFMSADGKTKIHAVKWMPESGDFKAICQISHGMVEYIERYRTFAEFLTEKGYLVVGHDHLGHGKSVTTEDDWGYVGLPNPSDLLVSDMHTLRAMMQKQYPDLPYFMAAHSMGSYLLRKYLTIHNDHLKGAIILGTGQVPDATTKLGIFVVKLMAIFRGWHYRSKFVADASFGKPYRQYDLTGADPTRSWLTKDEELVKSYYVDPYCSFIFTLNGYLALYETVLYDNQPQNIAKMPKNLPLFIISGDADPVGDMGVGVKRVYDMYKDAGVEDITYKLYENDRHEILNELDKQMVYMDILSWMNIRC